MPVGAIWSAYALGFDFDYSALRTLAQQIEELAEDGALIQNPAGPIDWIIERTCAR